MEAKRIMNLLSSISLPTSTTNTTTSTPSLSSSLSSTTTTSSLTPIQLDKHTFVHKVHLLASKIDTAHTIPLSISMLLVGSSVGIVVPIMPYIVSSLGLSAGQYGVVVSSFALAKLFANVPAAIMVEKHGRKPYLVHSLIIKSIGVGGIGLASQFEHLVLCRLMTGVAVSVFSTAATLTAADCSTPLNRASTMAPLMSAFAAGMAMGPVIGGVFADKVGVESTFYLVGGIYLSLTVMNHFVLTETKMITTTTDKHYPWIIDINKNNHNNDNIDKVEGYETKQSNNDDGSNDEKNGITDSMKNALSQWIPLLEIQNVRNVVLMNGFYWAALSGSQMTLLPLILTDPNGLAFTATQMGQVYMGMSLVQVLGNPVLAPAIDKIGKVPGIVTGCTFLSTAMFALPFCTEMTEVAGTCGLWALGSTMLSTAPVSYISDNVSDSKRAQAIALFRTAGDVGFLLGAMSTGAVADYFNNMDVAVHANAGILLTATGWFTTRTLLGSKENKK
jgi:MFS family permease